MKMRFTKQKQIQIKLRGRFFFSNFLKIIFVFE